MRNLTSIIVLGQALAMACGCGEAPLRGDGDDAYVYGEASHWDSNLTRDAPNGGNLDGGADSSVDLSADGAGQPDSHVDGAKPDAGSPDADEPDAGKLITMTVGPEILSNPGFEETTYIAGCVQKWKEWTLGSVKVLDGDLTTEQAGKIYTAIDTTAVNGAQACKITCTAGNKAITVMEQNHLVPEAPETFYFVEGFVKTNAITDNRAVVFLEFYTSSYDQVGEWAWIDLPAANTQPFTRTAGIIKTPNTATLGKMGLKAGNWNTAGELWLDAFSIKKVTSKIEERSFEAEAATLGGGATLSGSAVKLAATGAYVEWTVNLSAAGERTIVVRWQGTARLSFSLNGQHDSPRRWGTSKYATRHIHRMMQDGSNVVRIARGDSGTATIDKITILEPK